MSFNTLPHATTDDQQKQLCVLLALIISSASQGYQNSTQQITKRLYNHLKNGYSFSQAEVTKYTKQLEADELLWKLPYGAHFRISINALAYVIINVTQQPKILNAFLTEAIQSCIYFDNNCDFLFVLFSYIRQQHDSAKMPKDLSQEIDFQVINLLAQSQYSSQVWHCLPKAWQQLCLEHFIRGQFSSSYTYLP